MAKKNSTPVLPEVKRPTRYGRPDQEQLDTTPVEMPFGACRPTPLADLIARMVKQAVEAEKEEEFETLEESDDFEEEDPDTLDLSPYELQALQEETPLRGEIPPPPPLPETGDRPDPDAEEPAEP